MRHADQIDVNAIVRQLAHHWWLALALGLVGAAAAAALVATAGLRYRATATFVVFPSSSAIRDMALELGRSRRAAVGAAHALRQQEGGDGAVAEMAAPVTLGISRGGLLEATSEHSTPQRAAVLANAYVEQIRQLLPQYTVTDAGRLRQFLTEQLATTRTRVREAREALRRADGERAARAVHRHRRREIEAEAAVRAEIASSELQLQILRVFTPMALAEQVGLALRLEDLKRSLARLSGEDDGREPAVGDAAGSAERVLTLVRDARVHEALVSLIQRQIDRARMNELREAPTIEVVDAAIPPNAAEPRRAGWKVGSGFALGALAGVLAGIVIDAARRRRRLTRAARVSEIGATG
jgi:uncharacterized protein involved in exopolysaccharide biosynthesis